MEATTIIILANIISKLVFQFIQTNPNATQEEVDKMIATNIPLIQQTIIILQAEMAKYEVKP